MRTSATRSASQLKYCATHLLALTSVSRCTDSDIELEADTLDQRDEVAGINGFVQDGAVEELGRPNLIA